MLEQQRSQRDADRLPESDPKHAPTSVERPEKNTKEKGSAFRAVLCAYLTILVSLSIAAIIVVLQEEGAEPSWLRSMSLSVRQLLLVIIGGILGGSLAAIKDLLASLENP